VRPESRVRRALGALLLLGAGCTDETATPPAPPPVRYDDSRGFVDVFAASGVTLDASGAWPFPRMGSVNAAALSDCDADGLPDAFVFNWGGVGGLWRNRGGLRFEPLGALPGLERTAASAASFGDLDNDGRPDLVVSVGVEEFVRSQAAGRGPIQQELRVFRNQGNCRFEDVSAAWGFTPWQSANSSMLAGVDLADVNLDGRLDLVTRRVLDADAPVRLYLSRPDGTWVESMREVFGDAPGGNWTNFFSDVDDDGLAELFLLFDENLGPPARYLHRVSAAAARPYAEEVFDPRTFGPASHPSALMGAASGDVDGDGMLDLYLLDLGPQHLYTHRSGRRDVAVEAGVDLAMLQPSEAPTVAFGASLADYDNDTWPDLAVAVGVTDGYYTPPTAFLRHNRRDGTFEDATPLLHQRGTFTSLWMTASDLDRDGRVDYWMGGAAEPPRILRNEVLGGRSLAVRLRGRTSNAEGVGAKVTVRVGARRLVQEMQGGGSPWGYGEHRLVFGLGGAAGAESVEVRWPDGYEQRTAAVAAGAELVVEEPELLRVEPPVAAVGASVRVTVRPARPTGEPLGPGRRVEVTLDPGDVALAVTDDGAGRYTAATAGLAAGLYGFTVRIDGTALRAHPQALVR
jgi:hypothetical protein